MKTTKDFLMEFNCSLATKDKQIIEFYKHCKKNNLLTSLFGLFISKAAYGLVSLNEKELSVDDKLGYIYRTQLQLATSLSAIAHQLASSTQNITEKLEEVKDNSKVSVNMQKEQFDKMFEVLMGTEEGRATIRQLASEGVARDNAYLSEMTYKNVDKLGDTAVEKSKILEELIPLKEIETEATNTVEVTPNLDELKRQMAEMGLDM